MKTLGIVQSISSEIPPSITIVYFDNDTGEIKTTTTTKFKETIEYKGISAPFKYTVLTPVEYVPEEDLIKPINKKEISKQEASRLMKAMIKVLENNPNSINGILTSLELLNESPKPKGR